MLDLVCFMGRLGAARAGGCLLGSVAAPGGSAGWRWERGDPLDAAASSVAQGLIASTSETSFLRAVTAKPARKHEHYEAPGSVGRKALRAAWQPLDRVGYSGWFGGHPTRHYAE